MKIATLLLTLLSLPALARAQVPGDEQPLQVSDYANGLAAMVDEAHLREVHLHAELAALQTRMAAASQQVAQLQAAAKAASAPAAPATSAPAPASDPAATPATH